MALENVEREICALVIHRFLDQHEATPRSVLLRKFKGSLGDALRNLVNRSILSMASNTYLSETYLPRAIAFHLCGDADLLSFARRSTEIVLQVLYKLFDLQLEHESKDQASFTPNDALMESRKIDPNVDVEMIRVGLFLAEEFGVFSTLQRDAEQVDIISFQPGERIFEVMDTKSAWDDFCASRTQWAESQTAGISQSSGKVADATSSQGSQGDEAGEYAGWEVIRPLSRKTGQSDVYLVRSPRRVAELSKAASVIQNYAGRVGAGRAQTFAAAIWQSAREDSPSDLGALKVFKLRDYGAEAEQEMRARLRGEVRVLQEGRPGLLRLLASDEENGWIVTEYQVNGTLADHPLLHKGKAAVALAAFLPLVQTVAALHTEGIVHRDIKPANVFIGSASDLILGDFGIVYLPDQPERVTRTGESVGPHDYVPAWVDLGERLERVEPRFDVYMLGKLLWCMVAGKLKLTREYFRHPLFDVTKSFPDDRHMHIINEILGKCLVEKAEDCLQNATVLLSIVDTYLRVIERGGSLLGEKVPRPCGICGMGHYQLKLLHQNTQEVSMRLWHGGGLTDISTLRVHVSICDNCNHVEFFQSS